MLLTVVEALNLQAATVRTPSIEVDIEDGELFVQATAMRAFGSRREGRVSLLNATSFVFLSHFNDRAPHVSYIQEGLFHHERECKQDVQNLLRRRFGLTRHIS